MQGVGVVRREIEGLSPASTVIPAENLKLLMVENVLRLYMAESSTSTSLYQHWLAAKEAGQSVMQYAGHELTVSELEPNGLPEKRAAVLHDWQHRGPYAD